MKLWCQEVDLRQRGSAARKEGHWVGCSLGTRTTVCSISCNHLLRPVDHCVPVEGRIPQLACISPWPKLPSRNIDSSTLSNCTEPDTRSDSTTSYSLEATRKAQRGSQAMFSWGGKQGMVGLYPRDCSCHSNWENKWQRAPGTGMAERTWGGA